jgi:type VI secretion system secreted protein VgrG
VGGTSHAADAAAAQALLDLTTAYDYAAGRTPTGTVSGDLVGQTFTTGVYHSTSSLALSGTLTLDGGGNPKAVFIFQMASTLTTAASNVNLINGAQAGNVFWQVGNSATLGTSSSLTGTILALTSITVNMNTNAAVKGRALARNGAVTLDTNTFTPAVAGSLSITLPAVTVSLGSVVASANSQAVNGLLGAVKVTDTRGGTTGWTASADATDFTGPQTIAVSAPDPAATSSRLRP